MDISWGRNEHLQVKLALEAVNVEGRTQYHAHGRKLRCAPFPPVIATSGQRKKRKMTLSEIIEARKKILSNAEELIEEGAILFNSNKYPRAFALAHLACEELAKLPVLNTAALNILICEKNDWQKTNRRLVSHTEKLRLSAGMDYMWEEVQADDSDVRRYEKALEAVPDFNNLKNASLYAGFHNHKFVQPSELIKEELSKNMLCLARYRLGRYREHEKAFHEAIVTKQGKSKLADLWRSYRKIHEIVGQTMGGKK